MRQNILKIIALFIVGMVVFGCATSMKRKYTKKDHFMVGKYEVGAIEYETGRLEDTFTKWSFPVYLNGQKIKTYHFVTQAVSEVNIQHEARKSNFVQVREWALQEEMINGSVNNIERYNKIAGFDYSTVKQYVVDLLKNETP